MDINPETIVETPPHLARKRLPQKSKWKRNVNKTSRYSPKAPPNIRIPCNHYSTAYRCSTLSKQDVIKLHSAFYKSYSKTDQDNFIIKHTSASTIKRRRPKTGQRAAKKINIVYYARRRNNMIPVCRKTFLHILDLKKGRVNGVVTRHFNGGGTAAQENRGGNHKAHLYAEKKYSIKTFIKSLKPLEIHYCRGQIKCRQYLPSDLNIKKLYKMYIQQADDIGKTVKASYFRRIFVTCFNIGFGSPRTDVCSTCLQYQERIKHETNQNKKKDLMIQKRVHTLRAKAFYSLLKENEENLLILSFDCQKNQPMPKIPDQSTYFSRQLYIYNFTIVIGHSKTSLKSDNVFSYIWTEDLLPKASNEIASAVFHCLSSVIQKHERVTSVRLVCDGCSGQNKNTTMLGMACKFLMDHASDRIKTIEIVFPIVGHSFLPPDRVFAQIEKKIKKVESIPAPEDYQPFFEEHATVFHLGKDVEAMQWKEASMKVLKTTSAMHFSIKKCKRFFLKKNKKKNYVVVRAQETYHNRQGDYKNICKKNFLVSQINPEPVPIYIKVKDAKINDVKTLLNTHYGEDWETVAALKYFKDVINRPLESQNEYEEECCEALEETPELHI